MIPKSENVAEEMVAILEALSEYVPEIQVESNMEQQGVEDADMEKQSSGEVVPFPVPLAGDMLTAARARTAREIRVTSSGKSALRGLFPFPADWHAKVNFMEVRVLAISLYISNQHLMFQCCIRIVHNILSISLQIMWHRLYKGGSSLEGGTLQQLRNLINRRNISATTNVTGRVNEVEDFLELIVRCHIVAAAMHFF